MRKNAVEPDRSRMTVWRMRIAYVLPKATNTHSEYVILTAFPLQLVCMNAPECYDIRTVRSESRCALRLRYVDLVVSIEVAVEVCCCFTVFSC
jgi:hypothetical protein